MDNPCYDKETKTSCSKRCAGCSVNCSAWAEYTPRRNKNYVERHENKRKRTLIDSYEVQRTKRIQRGVHHGK